MQMEPQNAPNCEPLAFFNCKSCVNHESILVIEKDGACHMIASSQNPDIQKPVKKKTRQWAAWTRQEEERFFTALRQFGKNFEKITCLVQTKNKDQVRHYYYRLVKRMNKLLGPGVCLDAKNSKDTNAAMLRWWSVLEKFSWKTSKLHLKPRRFKIFVETLENQLLKDQRKGRRRKQSDQESFPPSVPSLASNHSRVLGHDNHSGKVVVVDTRNIIKPGVKRSSIRLNANLRVNRSNCKGDSIPVKKMTQRKKPSIASTASYKKWEKAAMAGVSLVADAAEHLEKETVDKENAGKEICDCAGKDGTLVQVDGPSMFSFSNVRSTAKLKLQLFPVDEATRRALEMDNHNPHLELTLGIRKKISSVLEHLNRKWGNCSIVASGELVLFPYNNDQIEKTMNDHHQRWSQDSVHCAGDIHGLIGSPPVFRLRYGWISKNKPASTEEDNKDNWGLRNETSLSVGEWADSLTNISVGDLLSEVVFEDVISNYVDRPQSRNCQNLEEQLSFNCDSFDAAIAAHVQKFHQKQTNLEHSIWDAEETCDAFSFRKNSFSPQNYGEIGGVNQSGSDMLSEDLVNLEKLLDDKSVDEHINSNGKSANDRGFANEDLVDDCPLDSPIMESSSKDLNGLTDIYWPDSFGPLELDFCSSRYHHNEDVILSNSLGSMNRLLLQNST
ncbi:TSL-kinase interacting protein 1-like isoform X2 [Impatiens glandulifera]|uniref:TSL-kinase interacting protein 1-like isoform X2 n=1 Tax=Impatiens glandulifera TaxID=253017 RepID=UPI001FB130B4|nr:TSL-kinase interacting protein 1-like isoform X2 [Impatiens glandulifera]